MYITSHVCKHMQETNSQKVLLNQKVSAFVILIQIPNCPALCSVTFCTSIFNR